MTTTYPSCRVRIKVRVERDALLPTWSRPKGPTAPEGFADAFYPLGADIIPFEATVIRNTAREADTAHAILPLRAFPVDPRYIRAASVQVFMGLVDPVEWVAARARGETPVVPDIAADGVTNEVFRGFVDSFTLNLVDGTVELKARDTTQPLLDARLPENALHGISADLPIDDVIRLLLFGEPAAALAPLDPTRVDTLPVDARADLLRARGVLAALDAKLAKTSDPAVATRRAQVALRVAEMEGILAVVTASPPPSRFGLPGMRGVRVVNESSLPVLPPFSSVSGGILSHSKAKKAKKKAGKTKPKPGKPVSFWDFITDLVVSAGLIVEVRTPRTAIGGALPASEIVITDPKTYHERRTIYPGGDTIVEGSSTDEVRSFAWGRNVTSLEITRDYAGENVPKGVEVRAIDASTGALLRARYPTDQEITRVSISESGDKEEVQIVNYGRVEGGPHALGILQRVARSVHDQMGIREHVVRLSTSTLSALPSSEGKVVADMLRLGAAEPIEVDIADTGPPGFTLTTAGVMLGSGLAKDVEYLKAVGFSAEAAAALAAGYAANAAQKVFRTTEVTYRWGHDFSGSDGGFSFEIVAQNYLDARGAAEPDA